LAVPNENILRQHRSKKPIIITFAVMIFILFLLVSYGYYAFLDYEYVNGEVSEFAEYFIAISHMTSCSFTLPFTFQTVIEILKFQLSIWYIYIAVLICIFIYMTSRSRNDFKNMEHGSARWANKYEIKQLQKDTKGIPLAKDTYLPLDSDIAANLNEVVIGGSGAGKSFRKIKPDILQLNGSYVVTDPKGELYRDCAKVLKDKGYKVRVLNLVNVNYSNSYNPFAYITSEQDVVNVSSLFMKNTGGDGEKEDFFIGAAGKLLTALMLYLFKSENEIKTFGRVIRLLNSIRYKNGYIDMSCELARCLNKHASLYPNDAATINWSGMQANAQETQSSINEVLSTRLSLWSTTDLDAITSTDEMDFDSIGKEKTAIFLILPAARNTYKVVVNLFYSQLFERLMRVAESKYNGSLPLLVSCELDEFANIGEIPNFNETLSVVRSYNIRICIVLQGLSQLKAIYEKTYDAIIGNCDTFTLLGSKDKETLEYVSEKLDKITVRNDSRSYNRGSMQGGGGQDTEAVSERPLLYPAEIKEAIKPKGESRKYGGNSIIFVGYEKPIFLPKFDTINHPLFPYCGSKYKEYVHNNTYVEEEYAPVWKKRLEEYQLMYDSHNAFEEESKKEFEQQAKLEDESKQQDLEKQFEINNPVNPPDPDRKPTEEEYQDYVSSADRVDYDPVPDFDDDFDGEFDDELLNDDVAPVVEMLNMFGGDE
jgi:type IV secretion system protein VirD4